MGPPNAMNSPPRGIIDAADSINPWRIRSISCGRSCGAVSLEKVGSKGTSSAFEIRPRGVCTSKLAYPRPAAAPTMPEAKNRSVNTLI